MGETLIVRRISLRTREPMLHIHQRTSARLRRRSSDRTHEMRRSTLPRFPGDARDDDGQ